MARWRSLVLVAALVVLCGGCRVDIDVGLDANTDGSGRVRVQVVADKEVAGTLDLSAGVRADDLRQAGWTVDGPTPRPDGGVQVVASKPFDDADGARRAVEELSGPTGPFQAFRLTRRRSFARTTTRFSGQVDFAKGIDAFGDPALKQALGGSDVGLDLPRLEQALNGPLDKAVGVQVAVRLPGSVTSNAPQQTSNGARWQLRLRDRVDLTAQSSAWNVANLAAAALAALVVLGVLAYLVARRRGSGRKGYQAAEV